MVETVPGPEYEQRVRAAAAAGEPAPEIAPPEDYEMTADFQQWLIDQMQAHVMEQVSSTGLDRAAIVKIDAKERKDATIEGDAGDGDGGDGGGE